MMKQTTLPKSFSGYDLESGCATLVKQDTLDKLESRSVKYIFVGYPQKIVGYYLYNLHEKNIFVARYAEFFENSLTLQKASERNVDLELIQEDDTRPSENTSEQHDEVVHNGVEPHSEIVPIHRSSRIPQAPDRYSFYVDAEEHEFGDLNKPPNYKAASLNPESHK
ncbi:hypothetical protein Tco_0270969 [Tanacetum coccineum]